jgi:hypothetical protein
LLNPRGCRDIVARKDAVLWTALRRHDSGETLVPLFQPHARLIAVGEFDAGFFQSVLDGFDSARLQFLIRFQSCDCIGGDFGHARKLAHAAIPHMQKALADKAQLDLKPFANDARAKIAAALKKFQQGLSSPAQADDPVRCRFTIRNESLVITGCPAFAGHDKEGVASACGVY